jgi:hypothetical protein
MHREELVVGPGVDKIVLRRHQLKPDDQGLDPANKEEKERSNGVGNTDLLVVDGCQEADNAGLLEGTCPYA